MQIWLTGGGWITAAGHGQLRGPAAPACPAGEVKLPPPREIFSERLPRWGRYDDYTRCGLIGLALALRDAGLEAGGERRPIGLVTASALDCFATDVAYYQTTLEQGGGLASPNLFSYTLPGIMLGEAAILFQLGGPTLCVGEAGGCGMAALACALDLMHDGAAPIMVAGWVDCIGDAPFRLELGADQPQGAAFVVLATEPKRPVESDRTLVYNQGKLLTARNKEIESIFDLLAKNE